MKKKITLFLAVVSFLSLTGCDKSQEQTNETETAKEHITFETETLEQLSGLSGLATILYPMKMDRKPSSAHILCIISRIFQTQPLKILQLQSLVH